MIMRGEIWTEVALSADRQIIMECVSQQKKEFRFAEIYFLLKKNDSERWQAKDVKIALEWLADMGLVRRKIVKAMLGQKWLFYQSRFDHGFLLSHLKQERCGHCMEDRIYICRVKFEILRYKYACIKERLNRALWNWPYSSPFVIAEIGFARPMTLEEKQLLKKKIEELDK